MPKYFTGTYTTTQVLSNPTTDNPATVTSTGLICVNSASAYQNGIFGDSFAWTLTNLGTVESIGNQGFGIYLKAGGFVTNGQAGSAAGLIAGSRTGLAISGGAATLANFGTIVSLGTAGGSAAVDFHAGGVVTNGASGSTGSVITGIFQAIGITGSAGTVTNFGSISATGTGSSAVYLQAGGAVANFGTIAAAATSGVGVVLLGGGTISNSGVISAGHFGVEFYGAVGTLVNLGTIAATDPGGYATGVFLHSGLVTNGQSGSAAASITGTRYGVWVRDAAGTIANYGAIAATDAGSKGIFLQNGGAVTNGTAGSPAASISGASLGIAVHYAAGTVNNYGTIAGTGTASTAIYLTDGGAVTNQDSGLIAGGGLGVRISGEGTIANLGSIVAGDGLGVVISLGGSVTNGATDATGALISGVRIYSGATPSTVTNFAAIVAAGTGNTGVSLGDGVVTNHQSGVIEGFHGVYIGGGSATLVNLGTVAGTGGYGVVLGGDGTVANTASGVITGGTGVRIAGTGGTVGNLGTITGTATYGTGVGVGAGGSVTNGASGATIALISGVTRGVQIDGGGAAGTVTNFATIAGTGTSNAAVYVGGGGAVTNQQGGLIEGGYGVGIGGGAGTLINLGTIAGTAGGGAFLGGGGSVDNGTDTLTDASIAGSHGGVRIDGSVGTVVNFGSIIASVTYAVAIKLQAGGLVTNQESGLVQGGGQGIRIDGGAGTVTNLGTVAGVSETGVVLGAGGTVANGASGPGSAAITGGSNAVYLFAGGLVINGYLGSSAASISGGYYGVSARYVAATVTNYGTIAGISAAAIFLDHGGTVTNEAGALVTSSNTGIQIRNAGGTLDNSGAVQAGNFAVYFAAGGTVTNRQSGAIEGGGGISIRGAGTVDNLGTITGTATNSGPGIFLDGGSVSNGTSAVTDASIAGSRSGVTIYSGAGTVTNFGTIAASYTNSPAVYLRMGGAVVNQEGGFLRGGGDGIKIVGSAGTVANLGTVAGITERGVALGAGGTIVNGTSIAGTASIAGYSTGVALFNLAGGVANHGTIAGTGTGSTGVYLGNGGAVTNGQSGSAAGSIFGGHYGIRARNAAATIVNYGAIAANYSGIDLGSGGTVTNSGVISGGTDVIFVNAAPGTITNFGTISGTSGAAIWLNAGGTVTNSGVIRGMDDVIFTNNGLGTVVNNGTIFNIGSYGDAVCLDAGGNVINNGSIQGNDHGVEVNTNPGMVTNYGAIVGTTGIGVYLAQGGTVTNGATSATGAYIGGYFAGIRIENAAGAVTNFATIVGSGNSGPAVYLGGGGVVTNQQSGFIRGSGHVQANGIRISGSAGTVVNIGTIAADHAGIYLNNGGYVLNGQNAVVQGYYGGVAFRLAAGTVVNLGTIAGTSTFVSSYGVVLVSGGSVTNGQPGSAAASISGVVSGITAIIAVATIVNYGTIAATGPGAYATGLDLRFGGLVTNGQPGSIGASISGGRYGISVRNAAGTVANYGTIAGTDSGFGVGVNLAGSGSTLTNAGTISGAGGTAVAFAGGGNRLIVDPGAVFSGSVYGGTANDTLELTAAAGIGTLSGIGTQYLGFTTVTVDAGARWSLSGSNTLGAGVTLTDLGTLTNLGSLSGAGGLVVDPASLINSGYIRMTVTLSGGGYLDNTAPGTISAAGTAVYGIGGAAALVNAGTIAGTDTGVVFEAGGIVTNAAAALIAGVVNGVYISGSAGTVVNSGTIGGTGAFSDGVYFAAGGNVTNGAGAVIAGDLHGVLIRATPSIVTNFGTIQGTGGFSDGVYSGNGGSVANGASASGGARIVGVRHGVYIGYYIGGGTGTVTNFGTILGTGTTGDGIQLAGGGSVANVAGALVGGVVNGVFVSRNVGAIGNFGTIQGTGTNSDGVHLLAGGHVANYSTGLVRGVTNGVQIDTNAGTVGNFGTIEGTGTSSGGVFLAAGGSVTNASGGVIRGGNDGVAISLTPGTVTNSGSIEGTGTYSGGIYLTAGGSVVNASGGVIRGGADGIAIGHAAGIVTNLGMVEGTGTSSTGVFLFAGGSVTNGASGSTNATITGSVHGIIIGGTAGTVANYGTIVGGVGGVALAAGSTLTNAGTIGGGGAAVVFSGGNNRLIVGPGAVFSGAVTGGGGTGDVLELAAGGATGTIGGLDSSFTGFESVAVDSSAVWLLTGSNTLGAGTTLANLGTLEVGAMLSLGGSVVNGGIIDIEAGARLTLANGASGAGGIAFAGPGGTLEIDGSTMPANTIIGFAPSDAIDLRNLAFTSAGSAVLNGSTLTVTGGGGVTDQLTLTGIAASITRFATADDGLGGTSVIAIGGTNWSNSSGGDWTGAANWSDGVPTPTSDATIGVAGGYTVLLTASGAANALTIANAAATLDIETAGGVSPASLGVQQDLSNGGTLDIDVSGGSSRLTIGGTLINTGSVNIGQGNLTAPTTVTASGLTNFGTLVLIGDNSNNPSSDQATLAIAGAAPSTLTGFIRVEGNADLEFASGGITAIAGGATLGLFGAQARVSLSGSGVPIANAGFETPTVTAGSFQDFAVGSGLLTGWTVFGPSGTNVSVVSGSFTQSGVSFPAADGTEWLDLTGNGSNSTEGVSQAVATVIGNRYQISYAVGNTTSGGIFGTTSTVQLSLNGVPTFTDTNSNISPATQNWQRFIHTFVATGTATTLAFQNGDPVGDSDNGLDDIVLTDLGPASSGMSTALSGLASNAGTLNLDGGSPVGPVALTTTTGFANTGTLNVDGFDFDGGANVTFGGSLTNSGLVTIGVGNLTASTTVTASGLANTGTLNLIGNGSNQATLDITGAAPSTLTGFISLQGNADLEFAGGGITGIASGATLNLFGAQARISIGADTTSTALSGLASNAGTLNIEGGSLVGPAALTTTIGLSNTGIFNIDSFSNDGGTGVTIGGLLSNSGVLTIGVASLAASTNLTASGLANTGTINLIGNGSNRATLDITGAGTDNQAINLSGNALFSAGSLTVSGGGTFTIGSGGTAIGVIVGSGGLEVVSSGGTSFAPTIAGGIVELRDGAVASGTTVFVGGGGVLQIDGATMPTNTIGGFAPGDTIDLRSVAGGGAGSVTLGAGNVLTVSEGGSAYTLQLDPSQNFAALRFALADDSFGGTAIRVVSGGVVGPGEVLVLSAGQSVSGITVLSGGTLIVGAGATLIGGEVFGGGTVSVGSGGVASGTVVLSGGSEIVQLGGVDVAAVISGGGFEDVFGSATGTLIFGGGSQTVEAGGSAEGTVLDDAAVQIVSGFAGGTVVSATDLQIVESGGVASGTIVSSGGSELVHSGGVASHTTVSGGGSELVFSGGLTIDTTIAGGFVELMAGAVASGTTSFIATGGPGGVLRIDGPSMPAGPIAGFARGDAIDLRGLGFSSGNSVSFDAGTGALHVSGGVVDTLSLIGVAPGTAFALSDDGQGGTAVREVPPAPSGLALLSPQSDSGILGDNLTNDTTPVITGSGEAGDTVLLFADGVFTGQSTIVAPSGGWILAPDLGPGVHVLTATESDGADFSAPSAGLTLTIDTSAPQTAPVSASFAFDGGPRPIGIAAPGDVDNPAGSLAIKVVGLPGNGTVTLADGVTPVTVGEALTIGQLSGLLFAPAPDQLGVSDSFSYTVTDPADNAATGGARLTVTASATVSVFDFVFTYNDGNDYYYGKVADNGTFGYHVGQQLLFGAGQYIVFDRAADPAPVAAGSVFVTNYSHGGPGAATTTPDKTAAGEADGTNGLGSERDAVRGTDGQPHGFSSASAASFATNALFGFVFSYADGAAFYTGTVAVASGGTPAIPSSGGLLGSYWVFAAGASARVAGTVVIDRFTAGGASYIPAGAGAGGLGSEAGSITVNGTSFSFSDQAEPVIPSGIAVVPVDPAPDPNDVVTSILTEIYREVLDRPVDPSGLATYGAALVGGGSAASVRQQIAASDEARDLLQGLYHQIFGRDADPGGLATYRSALANGSSLTAVRLILGQSAEAQDHIGQLYQEVLGRPADGGGLATYMAGLANGASLAGVRGILAHSLEAASDLVPLFQDILGRPPGAAELIGMEDLLAGGATQESLRSALTGTGSAGGFTTILAQIGDETLTAPPGVPTLFVFGDIAFGNDTIAGFDAVRDTIGLPHAIVADQAALNDHITPFGAGTLIALTPSHSIQLTNLAPASLTPANFLIL